MRIFVRSTLLAMAVQGALWILLLLAAFLLSPRLDSLIAGVVYVYYPTVILVESLANLKGDANILWPILLGVPIGIVVYGFIIGLILRYLKRAIV